MRAAWSIGMSSPGTSWWTRVRDRPDHVYLSDFGVAKDVVVGVADRRRAVPRHRGLFAPEQIKGLPVDGRTDQYALACVSFSC